MCSGAFQHSWRKSLKWVSSSQRVQKQIQVHNHQLRPLSFGFLCVQWRKRVCSVVVCPLTANSSSVSPLSLMDGTLWTHAHGHTYIHSLLGPLLTLIPMLSKLDMQHKNYTYTHTELSKRLSGQEVRALWQTRKCFPLQPKSSVSGPPACPPHFACKLFV